MLSRVLISCAVRELEGGVGGVACTYYGKRPSHAEVVLERVQRLDVALAAGAERQVLHVEALVAPGLQGQVVEFIALGGDVEARGGGSPVQKGAAAVDLEGGHGGGEQGDVEDGGGRSKHAEDGVQSAALAGVMVVG